MLMELVGVGLALPTSRCKCLITESLDSARLDLL